MLNNTTITVTGNLVADPELRFATNTTPVVEFRVLVNRRTKNDAGERVDAEPTGHTVKLWGYGAENIAESARKGDRLIVHGEQITETWVDKTTGEKRTASIVLAAELGISLAHHPARPTTD